MTKKEWFMLLRYPVPADLEYYLEEAASNGYFLKPLGEKGFFYYEFEKENPAKCKYMVDITALPKAMYIETLLNKNWEYLGTSGNCYVWRQKYDDTRPKDMSDMFCKERHCRNFGIAMLVLGLILFALVGIFTWECVQELKIFSEIKHIMFVVNAIINTILGIFSLSLSYNLFSGIKKYYRIKL